MGSGLKGKEGAIAENRERCVSLGGPVERKGGGGTKNAFGRRSTRLATFKRFWPQDGTIKSEGRHRFWKKRRAQTVRLLIYHCLGVGVQSINALAHEGFT